MNLKDLAALGATAEPAPALAWTHSFASLGSSFYSEVQPSRLDAAQLAAWNCPLAKELGIAEPLSADALCGNQLPTGARSLATVYSGHQFGQWAGQLGDGRALLLGELRGQELQMKGAGRTPYSRMGDGRAVLRSSVREYLCSEAMAALGIPTTRALCLVAGSTPVRREELETAAVVTRVAPSFIRFGHFEHFANADLPGELKSLSDYVISRFYPQAAAAPNPYAALLEAVCVRTAKLVAAWQSVGFCHGVLNTDNMSIVGLTMDYGPFGFMESFDPGHICNHSDTAGRYAYARQPSICMWNCYALAQALFPLINDQDATLAALERFKAVFPEEMNRRFAAKLGLVQVREGDQQLIEALLEFLALEKADFTGFFRHLESPDAREHVRNLAAFDDWSARYTERLQGVDAAERLQLMRSVNPCYVLRNHLAELAIQAAKQGDFGPMQRLGRALSAPYTPRAEFDNYAEPAPDWARSLEVSCSS